MAAGDSSGFLLQPKGLDSTIASWYAGPTDSLARSLADNYRLFGKLENKEELDLDPTPRLESLTGGLEVGSAAIAEYGPLREALNTSAGEFDTIQQNLAKELKKVEEVTKQGQENIGELIRNINGVMVEVKDSSAVTFVELIGRGIAAIESNYQDGAGKNDAIAAKIAEWEKRLAANDKVWEKKLADSVKKFAQQNQGTQPPGVQYPGGQYPGGQNTGQNNTGVDNPFDPGKIEPIDDVKPPQIDVPEIDTPGQDGSDLPGRTDPIDGGITDPTKNDPVTPIGSSPDSGIGSGMNPGMNPGMSPAMSPGMDPMGMMLPALMSMMNQRGLADTDMAGRRDIDPRRFERDRLATSPPPVPPQAPTTPWSNQGNNAAASTPVQQASAPTGSGVTPAANTTPPPGRIPGPDGGIVYTFPDGRTQKVSENVAKALDAAFADKSGTSAKEAYKNTAAKWEEDKRAGDSVDPSQLMTGDIATWTADTVAGEPRSTLVPDDKGGEARTALLVVFGPAESGTLEAICGGELQQFTPELSDAQGAFGEFSGFRRPRNIELAAPKGDTDTGVATGDPAATQAGAVPVVAPV